MNVSIGCLPVRLLSLPSAQRAAGVRMAEQAGLDHLGFGDHVSFYGGHGTDGLLACAGALALSDRLAANTAVYLLPLRHPVPVARQVTDLAVLAPGRFVFGVGIGGEDPAEVAAAGVDPRTRGRRMDEALTVLRGLLAGEEVCFQGEFFSLDGVRVLPSPVQPVPIVVGGRSDAAIARAGRLGDGWFGIWVSPSRYRAALDTAAQAAQDAGRAAAQRLDALNVWCGIDDAKQDARGHVAAAMQAFYGLPFERFERWSPYGRPEQVAEFLAPYLEAGCRLVNLIVAGRGLEHEIEVAGRVREQLLAGAA